MKLAKLWGDLEHVGGHSGRVYYRIATITWSIPKLWDPLEHTFDVPRGWAGHGGVYAFIRRHWAQRNGKQKVAYIGKATSFTRRLTSSHHQFDIVKKRGETLVSCGRVSFERIKSRIGYYEQIEDIIKFTIWRDLKNLQGFESLPGFRRPNSRTMVAWCIKNKGYRFGGAMPKRIIYPAFAVDF